MMKRVLIVIILLAGFNANAILKSKQLISYNKIQTYTKTQAIGTLNLSWVVGEKTEYVLSLLSMPAGTINIEVVKETTKGFWVNQNIILFGQTSLVEMLFDKQTGEILESIVDGESKEPVEEERVIMDQREERVTVPGGTFNSLYTKSQVNGQLTEEWVNLKIIPIFGLLRQRVASDMGSLSLALKNYIDL